MKYQTKMTPQAFDLIKKLREQKFSLKEVSKILETHPNIHNFKTTTINMVDRCETFDDYKKYLLGLRDEWAKRSKEKKTKQFDPQNTIVSVLKVIAENTHQINESVKETNRLLNTLPLKKKTLF